MKDKDYSLPMWVETDISKFVSGRLHYCNPSLLSPPEGFKPVGFAAFADNTLSVRSVSVSLGTSAICMLSDKWADYINSLEDCIWPVCIDEEAFNPKDRELTVEFTGMPVSDNVRKFAQQYLREFKCEEKLTSGDSGITLNKTGISVWSEN